MLNKCCFLCPPLTRLLPLRVWKCAAEFRMLSARLSVGPSSVSFAWGKPSSSLLRGCLLFLLAWLIPRCSFRVHSGWEKREEVGP